MVQGHEGDSRSLWGRERDDRGKGRGGGSGGGGDGGDRSGGFLLGLLLSQLLLQLILGRHVTADSRVGLLGFCGYDGYYCVCVYSRYESV